jgi:hypothetical protein
MAEFVLDDAGLSDANDVEKRYWAPSRSVIHLAAAALVVGHEFKERQISLAPERLLFSREWITEIIRRAEFAESLIASDTKAPVKVETLLKVRLV